MDISKIDWSHLQMFLAVAETGSLSAAARLTGHSQPTVGRQIKAIETALGLSLFDRQPRGFDLNATGAQLLAHAQKMRDAAAQISLIAAGQVQTLQGVVRITASELISHHYMPEIIAKIRNLEPLIEIELAPSNTTENLIFREADIALRMYQPTQLDVIAKKLGPFQMGIFASQDYLAKHGTPITFADFKNHTMVGFDKSSLILEGMADLGIQTTPQDFKVRCDSQPIYWELVRAGCGIGFTQKKIGNKDPNMVELLPDLKLEPLPVWLVAPEALRSTPRIRRVYDLLSEMVSELTDA